jgi:hypothetical protein
MPGAIVEVLAASDGVTMLVPATGEVLATHPLGAPGEASVLDAHYGRPRPNAAVRDHAENRRGEGVLSPPGRSPSPGYARSRRRATPGSARS